MDATEAVADEVIALRANREGEKKEEERRTKEDSLELTEFKKEELRLE